VGANVAEEQDGFARECYVRYDRSAASVFFQSRDGDVTRVGDSSGSDDVFACGKFRQLRVCVCIAMREDWTVAYRWKEYTHTHTHNYVFLAKKNQRADAAVPNGGACIMCSTTTGGTKRLPPVATTNHEHTPVCHPVFYEEVEPVTSCAGLRSSSSWNT
jgi:hypothetical protein